MNDFITWNINSVNVSGTPATHDLRISPYLPSVNGIRLSNRTITLPTTTVTNVIKGQNYTVQYNILNDGTSPNETARVIVKIGSIQIANYLRNITNSFSTPTIDFNASILPNGLQNITVNISIIGYLDLTANNFAFRTINVTTPVGFIPSIKNAPVIVANATNYNSVNVTIPNTLQFNITVEDLDLDSMTVNWSVNGTLEQTNTAITNNSIVSFNKLFNRTGNFPVTALVYDTFNASLNDFITWNINSVNVSGSGIIDTTPPASVTNLIVQNRTNSTIRWSWTNPIDVDFNSTLVSVNVAPNITLPKSAVNYTITNLIPNTVYRIIILTQDNATVKNVNNIVVTNLTRTLSNFVPPVNNAPVLAAIGNKNVNENQALTFTVSATDADLDPLTFTTSTLPTGAAFTVFNATARTFTWTPTYLQSGAYPAIFNVTDSKANISQSITITVNNVPQNGTISGFVFNGLTGLNGANVFVKNNTATIASTTSNVAGDYSVSVRTGTFSLFVTKPGFLDFTLNNVPVTELNTVYRNITLTSLPILGNLTGRITDSRNNIYKATVELRQGIAVIATATTGQDGLYSFLNVNNGPYTLVVTKPSFVDSNNAITINVGTNTRDVVLTQSATSGTISGRVLSGVDGVTPIITNVTIIKPVDGAVQIVQSNATGHYQINGLSITAGFTYNITATIKTPTYTQVFPLSGLSVNAGQTLTNKNVYEIP
mgnify:CR=1 FL=1